MKSFALSVLIILISIAPTYAAGWTGAISVDRVLIEDNIIAVFSTGHPGPYTTGCVSGSYIITMTTETARNQAISILLTASTTGKKVKFWYKDTCSNWNYHSISSIQFVPNQ